MKGYPEFLIENLCFGAERQALRQCFLCSYHIALNVNRKITRWNRETIETPKTGLCFEQIEYIL